MQHVATGGNHVSAINVVHSCHVKSTVITMSKQLWMPSVNKYANDIADRAQQIGMTDQLRLAHAAQQGPSTAINSGMGTSTMGTSEHTEGAFHQQVDNATTNNAESVSELAIVPAMTTSTPLHTSTSNTQTDETAADTEVNDVTNLKAKYHRESRLADIEDMIAYFEEKAKADADLFYRIRLDDEDRVKNMYWVDGAARRAYKHFGDCISFDATYLTNMYKMPRAPFIGINNHNQSLQFGCGLVRNEDTHDYTWLFKTFLECMGGLAPMNIITDQDFSMCACIEEVFSLAVHRHFSWHIIKKADETLGTFFADCPELYKAFELSVDHSLTVEEFEQSWTDMIETYQTTQRNEGFNAVLKRYVSPGNSLLQFAKQYTALQQKILGSELQQEANTALKQPKLLTYLPMERQMRKIYTNKIFNKFLEEIKHASMYTAYQVDANTFKVCSLLGMSDSEPKDPDKERNYFVKASVNEGEYYCQCYKFKRDGIVCCHILKVMDIHAITRLPRHFIRQRWTWDADDALGPQTSNAILDVHDERPKATMDTVRHVVLTKNYAELIDEVCKSDETTRVAEKDRKALKRELDEIKKRKAEEALHRFPRTSRVPSSTGPSAENSEVGSGTESTRTQVRNPLRSITKACPKEVRYNLGLEIQAKHKKTKKEAGNP
ncbi:protein FAR1-RELATED SEQUENCE 5-like [Triticum dicoccoides]|uniref:protein FAR1-RELATED SEQUENCE 5-like n=1 Tax=Triticum dicoccoides TaxID=85692 RepID=UPI00188E3697|nr:protein FAR1-RELATED SEQUENCE 5-like [Triticum dicoccoides]